MHGNRDRREFLRWASIASGTLVAGAALACGDEPASSPDASSGSDGAAGPDAADPSCRPTRGDAQGPFFVPGAPSRAKIAADDEPGERIVLSGRVFTSDCETPLVGALLDIWQADKDGVYHDAGVDFRLRGQVLTDAEGRFMVDTIKPGNYTLAENVWRPAHIHFTASMPGHRPVTTQLYFKGDPFLPPNDGCTTCGSDDADRVVDLSGDAVGGWAGEWNIVLART
jgi:catechol 1,2-dioxygenase